MFKGGAFSARLSDINFQVSQLDHYFNFCVLFNMFESVTGVGKWSVTHFNMALNLSFNSHLIKHISPHELIS